MRISLSAACGAALAGVMLTASLAAAQAVGPTLRLIGVDGSTRTLSLAELRALRQVDVTDSTPATGAARFRGPSVRSLISLVGAPEGHALRGPSMTLVVVAEARDGYRVAYSIGELDEQFGARTAIVALTQNDKPLSENDGPFRVIVGGESHHARWIRQLVTLRLVQTAGLSGSTPPNQ